MFLANHLSTPRYSIVEGFEDVLKAIQSVRFHAADYKIDRNRIGITGTSSGGNLALLAATAIDAKNPKSKDPVEQVSSRVQGAAVCCPPTEWLNYGKAGDKIRDK